MLFAPKLVYNIYARAKRCSWPQRKLSYATALATVESLGQSGRVDAPKANLQKIRKTLQKKIYATDVFIPTEHYSGYGGPSMVEETVRYDHYEHNWLTSYV